MENRNLIIYRVVAGLFSLMMLMGATMYFIDYDMVNETFTNLGVPSEVIYPLAIVKFLGIIAIWLIKSPLIKKLAYLGFALDLVLAIGAHLKAGDGDAFGPVIPLVLLIIAYWFYRKVENNEKIKN